jgi:hypothetical protein
MAALDQGMSRHDRRVADDRRETEVALLVAKHLLADRRGSAIGADHYVR